MRALIEIFVCVWGVEVRDEATRSDMRRWARDEFEQNRGVTDIVRFPFPFFFAYV